MTRSDGELSISVLPFWCNPTKNGRLCPVAEKTMSAGFRPIRVDNAGARHLVAVLAFDGVVLGDLSTPCEIFGRVRGRDGRPLYDVRICSVAREVKSEHVILRVPWRLSSLNRADTVIVPGIADPDQSIPEDLLRA